ncbi:MAG: hypothetical protein JWQ40_1696 [Segetibacter sp.]|jgi:hypothetical protein|nr:hypothetical protein [Segetibacter sp.]
MKIKFLFGIALGLVTVLPGCEKDNFEPPASTLSGQVSFQGQPIGVRSGAVQLEIWQSGYQLFSKIPVYINQDGKFSAALFDGDYKLTRLKGNGPWVDNTDTINVQVRGATTVDVPVQPYFVIKSQTLTKSGSAVTASVKIDKIVPTAAIQRVSFYIGTNQFVDANIKEGFDDKSGTAVADLSQNITLSITPAATVAAKGYVFGRVGVAIVGVPEMVYGPVQKIQL